MHYWFSFFDLFLFTFGRKGTFGQIVRSEWAAQHTPVQVGPSGAENTLCNTHRWQYRLRSKLPSIYCVVVLRRERYETKEAVRRDVEAPQKCRCLAACASQRRQSSLFGDDTHAVVHVPLGTRARITPRVWSSVSVGGKLGPSKCA